MTLRFGMIGCGSISRAHAVACRLLADDGLGSLVAITDPDPGAIGTVEQIAGPVATHARDAAALVADPDVDAVLVLAPTRFHRDLIGLVAAAGKALFTEKPLAPQYDTVREIVAAVHDSGIAAQVGFQSRFHPIIRFVHDAIERERYGRAMGYVIRDDQFWPTGAVVDGHTSWRSRSADAGGGALLEHSIHSCDIACWLFGPVTRVYAQTRNVFGYDVEDVAALTIEHANGVVGTLLTVFNGVTDREERRLEVFFERAALEATTDFVVDAPEDSLMVKEPGVAADRIDTRALGREMLAADGIDVTRPFYVYQYPALRAFAAAVTEGQAPTPGVADALAAHRVVEAAYRSAARHGPCSLVELDEGA